MSSQISSEAFSPEPKSLIKKEPLQPLLTFGSEHLVKKVTFKTSGDNIVSVLLYGNNGNSMTSDTMYMYEVIKKKCESIENFTEQLGRDLIRKYNLDEPSPFNALSTVNF